MAQRKQFLLCLVGERTICVCLSTIPPPLFLTEQKQSLMSLYLPVFEKYITVLYHQHTKVFHCFP